MLFQREKNYIIHFKLDSIKKNCHADENEASSELLYQLEFQFQMEQHCTLENVWRWRGELVSHGKPQPN